MMKDRYSTLIKAIVVVLVLGMGYLLLSTADVGEKLKLAEKKANDLQKENQELQQQVTDTQAELQEKEGLLNLTKYELYDTQTKLKTTNEELNETKDELNQLFGNLEDTKKEFSTLKIEVSNMQKTLNDSVDWFKDNSELPALNSFDGYLRNVWYEGFLTNVERSCTNVDDNKDVLNLACISYYMGKSLSFKYTNDEKDELYSIKEMIQREGGDCEDFSLFMKAIINHMEETTPGLRVEAWASSYGNTYQVYGNSKTAEFGWYDHATAWDMGEIKLLTPYVICYTITPEYGHCVVALSDKKITSETQVNQLKNAKLFEPQNGQYIGRIGESLDLCVNGELNCDDIANSIWIIITDDDNYQFTEGKWKGYHTYINTTKEVESNVDEILKKLN